ncbi:MAG: insulinase family protein, partial [Gemmatimonadaceae bacterium]|nr:insulinase family protein [Gemmatimonadaceae bacterium]
QLLAHPPAPGHIAAIQRIDSVGIQIWTLSNGVRVILKPTTFDANDVQVTSYRDGGTSYAPDSMLVPALTALPMVSQSGLGPYDAAALKKRLAGTSVAGGGMIGPFGEGLWGRSAPKDLTTLFQLLYLQFTAPRLDSSVFEQYAATLRDAVAHRAVSPEAAFSDTLDVVLADHSPRVRLLDDAYLRELDRAKSLAFFKQRFADATGFTFVIVGAFMVDSIKPLVERYLGGLPAAGARSTWRDTGLRRPDGIVTRVVRKGKEPKSAVTLVFLGPADRSRRERAVLTALGEVLRRRLWERLRQELGGVYGVSVTTQEEVVPTATSLVTVSFGADPARLAELTHEVFATITHLRRAGPTAAELATYKAEYRRARESDVRSNAFWIEAIALYDQRGWPLADVPTADRLVESITIADLAAAARRYLDLSHYVQVSLLPETPAS